MSSTDNGLPVRKKPNVPKIVTSFSNPTPPSESPLSHSQHEDKPSSSVLETGAIQTAADPAGAKAGAEATNDTVWKKLKEIQRRASRTEHQALNALLEEYLPEAVYKKPQQPPPPTTSALPTTALPSTTTTKPTTKPAKNKKSTKQKLLLNLIELEIRHATRTARSKARLEAYTSRLSDPSLIRPFTQQYQSIERAWLAEEAEVAVLMRGLSLTDKNEAEGKHKKGEKDGEEKERGRERNKNERVEKTIG